jgi:hypothetical protein
MNAGKGVISTVVFLCLLQAACTDSGEANRDALEDGAGGRDGLICDAVYVPLVTFTFMDAVTQKVYCGPATIGYEVVGKDLSGTAACDCRDDMMVNLDRGFECHVNPPEGETSIITVSVEGYDDFTAEVTLPYTCHPRAQVDVRLQPHVPPPSINLSQCSWPDRTINRAPDGDFLCAGREDCYHTSGSPAGGCPNTCSCICWDSVCYQGSCTLVPCDEPPVYN